MAWSRDGQHLVFAVRDPKTSGDLWRLPLRGDKKAVPFLQTPANETHGQLSPDGRWMTYVSNESRRQEVFVQSFPVPGTKYQLSTEGGTWPRWCGDGKEIVFAAQGRLSFSQLMSVVVQPAGEGLKFGAPQRLFDSGYFPPSPIHAAGAHGFAVAPDGQQFVVPRPARVNADPAGSPLLILVNWMAALRR